jgi:DNA topoisomerase-1
LRLVVSEKNIAAKRIAEILAVGASKTEKVYTTPVYTFKGRDGEDWVSIGLKGHIMGVGFPELAPSVEDPKTMVDLKKWRLESLPTLVATDTVKLAAEKGIIQSLKSLAKKADDVIIATDYDREGARSTPPSRSRGCASPPSRAMRSSAPSRSPARSRRRSPRPASRGRTSTWSGARR